MWVWGRIASAYVGNAILLALNIPLVGIFMNPLRIPFHISLRSSFRSRSLLRRVFVSALAFAHRRRLQRQSPVDDDGLTRHHRRAKPQKDDHLGDIIWGAAPLQQRVIDG